MVFTPARKSRSERENVEVMMEVHTVSLKLTGLLSSHSSWTVWIFPLAAEDEIKN